jgi:hypothetical protein
MMPARKNRMAGYLVWAEVFRRSTARLRREPLSPARRMV